MSENVHGTAVAVAGRAALIRGAPGSGKSDLALRCMALNPGALVAQSPLLVADDRVVVARRIDALVVTCPTALAGLIEVRGIGIVSVPFIEEAVLALVVDLVAPTAVERLPDALPPAQFCGLLVPRIELTPFELTAALKLIIALAHTSG